MLGFLRPSYWTPAHCCCLYIYVTVLSSNLVTAYASRTLDHANHSFPSIVPRPSSSSLFFKIKIPGYTYIMPSSKAAGRRMPASRTKQGHRHAAPHHRLHASATSPVTTSNASLNDPSTPLALLSSLYAATGSSSSPKVYTFSFSFCF